MDVGERLSVPGVSGYVATAEARVGRPLTPVSVAGAARRTTRRCATGVTIAEAPGRFRSLPSLEFAMTVERRRLTST